MNEPITDNLRKTLNMEESRRKSRAMITYTSDLLRYNPHKGKKAKICVKKTYVAQLFPRGRQHNQSSGD